MTIAATVASAPPVSCPACGAEGCAPVGYRTAEHRLMTCRACDLQFFDPMRNPGAAWYEENARYRDVLEVDAVNWNHRQFLDDRRLVPGRLLDVGCGTGGFLTAAQARGWDVAGIDFDEAAVHAARERLKVDTVQPWTLEEFIERRPGDRFDAVTAFEVLEHVEEPRSFLEQCFELTLPGGHFALSVPFRDRWPRWNEAWDEPPHHMTRWSRRALLTALDHAGFEAIDVRTGWIGSGLMLMNRVKFGIVSREMERATAARGNGASHLRRAALLHRLKTAAFSAVGVPVDAAIKLAGGTGFDMYVLARRPAQ